MIVSVCMATYNGAKHIRKQVDSILGQNLEDFPGTEIELVVSDDMSSDDTVKILEEYDDSRIKIYRHSGKKAHKYKKSIFAGTENFANV